MRTSSTILLVCLVFIVAGIVFFLLSSPSFLLRIEMPTTQNALTPVVVPSQQEASNRSTDERQGTGADARVVCDYELQCLSSTESDGCIFST